MPVGKMRLAENTKKLREQRGWTQTELANRSGEKLAHINRVEAGKYVPSLETAVKMADAFEVSIDDLVNGSGKNEEVKLEDNTFAEKIRLLNTLSDEDRKSLSNIIDGLLTKTRLIKMFREIEAG